MALQFLYTFLVMMALVVVNYLWDRMVLNKFSDIFAYIGIFGAFISAIFAIWGV